MPVRNIQGEYAIWLASAPTAGLLMQVLEFQWTNTQGVFSALFLGNHITAPTNVIFETGALVSVQPYQFECSMPERTASTEASITISGPLPGALFNSFQSLRGYQASFRISLTVRYFLYPGLLYVPLSNIPERYFVTSMTFQRTKLTIEASMARLPRFRAGIPYTIDEYPGLYEY